MKTRRIRKDKIIYALSVEDLHTVSNDMYGRKLSADEINLVLEKFDKYFGNWFETIEFALNDILDIEQID
jgi:hypothetical protein